MLRQIAFSSAMLCSATAAAAQVPDGLARSRAQALVAQAQAGNAQFLQAYGDSVAAVRSAGPAGSPAWLRAQAAIQRADAARAQTGRAQNEIERLAYEVEREAPNSDSVHVVRDARRRISDLLSQQSWRLGQLRSGRP